MPAEMTALVFRARLVLPIKDGGPPIPFNQLFAVGAKPSDHSIFITQDFEVSHFANLEGALAFALWAIQDGHVATLRTWAGEYFGQDSSG